MTVVEEAEIFAVVLFGSFPVRRDSDNSALHFPLTIRPAVFVCVKAALLHCDFDVSCITAVVVVFLVLMYVGVAISGPGRTTQPLLLLVSPPF